jgi:hypothetical protein
MRKPKLIFRSKAMEEKRAWQEGLKKALTTILMSGVTKTQVAVDLKVSPETVHLWLIKKRCPKFSTLKFIEQKYGVTII